MTEYAITATGVAVTFIAVALMGHRASTWISNRRNGDDDA